MATITNFLSKSPSLLPPISRIVDFSPSPSLHRESLFTRKKTSLRRRWSVSLSPVAAASGAATHKVESDERVKKVHTIEQFEAALRSAKNRLVVVEYAASYSPNSQRIYPFMVELSRSCGDVDFLLVMGDESEETKELCQREGIDKVPHFSFYKGMEKVHEEGGIGPDELVGDVLYYGDNHSAVVQLHSRDDVEALIGQHKEDGKLLVLDVGLKHCGPCVKVYPTVLKLSRSMADTVVFARMNGDENESCMGFLKDMEVVQVPTFLFIRDGDICGRYVGSGKGELIGEILRYQGVRVT
ncbi:hypothetical protein J5N97_024811 [Dioscorea zingiberensis]|uniref:Thioredoxin domain-containing protein n=1 Tax=Dioscorea zingiberensis TaxID=325984 RepID=A0A9D5H931_9LILI|nr:hypothetical protein J5N97_024811 [Dioscorea zingiberensis]